MFNGHLKMELKQLKADLAKKTKLIDGIYHNVAVIEFTPEGTVLDANQHFLNTMGYQLADIKGRHHSLFCKDSFSGSAEYQQFWKELQAGKAHAGTFERVNSSGNTVWISANYFPITNDEGVVQCVLKIASDVTEGTVQLQKKEALVTALHRSNAVIEFTPDGHILTANKNFENAMGYSVEEIQGQHHRMFCSNQFYQDNPNFWSDLAQGHFISGKFERLRKGGQVIWLEASYNPIYNQEGQVYKVIKFATDITDAILQAERTREAAEVANVTAEQTETVASHGKTAIVNSAETSRQIDVKTKEADQILSRLNLQAKSIEDIVATIHSVAEQTNLLALNAAIEAARAGDHGRGFAVVADEVRQLAARTSAATSEVANVVQENLVITEEVSRAIQDVAKFSERNHEQIMELEGIMTEILQGASNVLSTIRNIA